VFFLSSSIVLQAKDSKSCVFTVIRIDLLMMCQLMYLYIQILTYTYIYIHKCIYIYVQPMADGVAQNREIFFLKTFFVVPRVHAH